MTRKILSIAVALLMVLAVMPLGAMAEGAARAVKRAAELPTRDDVIVDGSLLNTGFENSSELSGWWSYDMDEDDNAWGRYQGSSYAHAGDYFLGSESSIPDDDTGSSWTDLTPDNWLVTAEFTVPNDGNTYYFTYYARSYFSGNYAEKMTVLIGEKNVVFDDEGITTLSGWNTLVSHYSVPNSYTQGAADLTPYAGKTVRVAFRHYNTNAGYLLMLDDVMAGIAGNAPEPTPTPTPPPSLGDLVQGYYFESGSNAENFTFMDKDGDGYNWTWQEDQSVTPYCDPYEGEGMIYSQSYDNDTSTALTPDNWAISPAVTLPNQTAAFSIYAEGQDASYCEEVFALYVGLTPNPDEMVKVAGDFTATDSYVRYDADLSAYAGQTVYVAIRHYNVTDMFYLNVDSVEVWGTGTAVVTHTVKFYDSLTNELIAEVIVNDGEAAEAPEPPVHEGYTFAGWDIDFSNVTEDLKVYAIYTENPPAGLLGDVNLDGVVDMLDVSDLNSFIVNVGTLPEGGIANGDINGDGNVDSYDSTLIAMIALGIPLPN